MGSYIMELSTQDVPQFCNCEFLNVNATTDVYFYSFFPRTLRMWNKLPKDIVESDSLETFKTKISKYFTE